MAISFLIWPQSGNAGDGAPKPPSDALETVATAIVLAIDASASVTTGGLSFQLRGHAAALADPAVGAAAEAGGLAVTVVAFSGPGRVVTVLPWHVARSSAETNRVSALLAARDLSLPADSTAIGGLIDHAVTLLAAAPVRASRQVIDIVTNGFSNAGTDPALARDRAVARDVTINALVFLDEYDWLEGYFREAVIGGANAFVIAVAERGDFAAALRRKLILEIARRPAEFSDNG